MIKATELRLGNLLLEQGEVSNVYMIDRGGISFYRINDIAVNKETGCTLNGGEDRFKPIPLTPDWLVRCGFEWYSSIHRWRHQETGYLIVESSEGFNCGYGDGSIKRVLLKYVHQLQNLHFAFTGVELTIKEPV